MTFVVIGALRVNHRLHVFSHRAAGSLFDGVPANDSQIVPGTTAWCDCSDSSSQCIPHELVQTCDFVEGG